MLNEFQTTQVWENMLAAETRALYFADLASRYTRTKQWMTGVSFFLASGAAASLIGKLPQSVPLVASAIVAVLTAYSMVVRPDHKINIVAKLHSSWNAIALEYEQLWSHADGDDAGERLHAVFQHEKDPKPQRSLVNGNSMYQTDIAA